MKARAQAKAWLARLEDMEAILSDEVRTEALARTQERRSADGIPRQITMGNRAALLEEIQEAKAFFTQRLK